MSYLILKKKYQEPFEPTTYYALDKDLFEEKAISHTFDKYGQNVTHGNAGDHLTLNTKQAVNVAYKVAEEEGYDNEFEVGETIVAFDHESFYIDLLNGLEKEVHEDDDYTLFHDTCLAYNYWDGNNWKSVIIEHPHYDDACNYEVVDNELQAEINDAIENRVYEKEEGGVICFTSNEYSIIKSYFSNDFEEYQITLKEEVENATLFN